MYVISVIDNMDEDALVALIKKRLGVEVFTMVIVNLDSDGIDGNDDMVSELDDRGSYSYTLKKIDLDMKN